MSTREPKEAVRQAISQAARGTTSGSWMSDDPRPGASILSAFMQTASGNDVYDIMLDAVQRGQEDAKHAAHDARASILYDLEHIAEASDSFRLATYTHKLRSELYPNKEDEK